MCRRWGAWCFFLTIKRCMAYGLKIIPELIMPWESLGRLMTAAKMRRCLTQHGCGSMPTSPAGRLLSTVFQRRGAFPEPAAALHRRDVFPEKRVAAIEPRPLWADHHLWRTGRSGGCHVWRPAVLCSGCWPCLGVQPAPSCATLPPCSGCRWSSDRLCRWSGAPAPSVAVGA